jgi:hypothetical protein
MDGLPLRKDWSETPANASNLHAARACRGRDVGLQKLMDAGLLEAGKGVISVKFVNTTTMADLCEDGSIACEVSAR